MPNTMPDKQYVLFPIGPLNSLPVLANYDPNNWTQIPSGALIGPVSWDYSPSGMEISGPWPANVLPMSLGQEVTDWITLCGFELKTIDLNTGEEVSTGYNILWQYKIRQAGGSNNRWFSIRLIKISITNPADITLLATSNGHAGIANIFDKWKYDGFVFAGVYTHGNSDWYIVGIGSAFEITLSPYRAFSCNSIAINKDWFVNGQYIDPVNITDDPNAGDPEGPSRPGGGDGGHNRKTEAVTLPDLPALGALDAGMITLYRLTGPEMNNFTSELWTFWSAVKAFFADPLDFVIGCMIVPFTPSSTRQAKPKFGADVWNTAFDVISEQFYSISCGTIDVEKYYGSCFDYDPYHKLEIYIPYVGYRELPVDQVMNKTIELTYHIDCMSGDFVAFVHTPAVGPTGPQLTQIICQFAGTMGVHVPLSRESFDSMVSAGINLLGGAVGMAAGGIAQAAGLEGGDLKANQIASQASSATVSAINSMKRNVIRSGSIGASSGMLAKQNPFIISTLPRQSLPDKYKDLEGYPSNIYGTVGSFSGFLAVETIKLNVTATSTEKEMIMQLLKGGVFV